MTVVKWKFTNLTTLATYDFELNPTEINLLPYQKHLGYENTLGEDGYLMFERNVQTQEIQFSGKILSSAFYDAIETWYELGEVVRLTDHLGVSYNVYIMEFSPKRKRTASTQWDIDYSMRVMLVN